MYDYIIVDKTINLPKPEGFTVLDFHKRSYQTKDTYCCLDTYKLIDGGLQLRKVERVYKEDATHFLGGYMVEVQGSEKWVKCSHVTDYIYFYDSWNDITPSQDAWIEYVAHIVDGNIIDIRIHKFELKSNAVRLQNEQRVEELLASRQNRSKTQKFIDDIRYHLRIKLLWLNNKHIDFANWINNQIHKL